MKTIIVGLALLSFLGCASADQKIASKQGYRNAQVEAIKVQAEQATARETAEQLSQAAMWQSLSEAVKANPESASHFAIVMAVAASNGSAPSGNNNVPMATLKTERDVTALDWAKVMTGPVLGTLTQVGIAALNTDLQKEISQNNAAVNMKQEENRGKIFDVIPAIAGAAGSTITMTDSTYVGNDFNNDERVNYIIDGDASTADDLIDDLIEETNSFGIPDDEIIDDSDVDDGADDSDGTEDGGPDDSDVDPDDTDVDDDSSDDSTPNEVDCSEPQFSPAPPECQES
jgi:hypothetical protein